MKEKVPPNLRKIPFTISIKKEIVDAFREYCIAEGLSQSTIIENQIKDYLQEVL